MRCCAVRTLLHGPLTHRFAEYISNLELPNLVTIGLYTDVIELASGDPSLNLYPEGGLVSIFLQGFLGCIFQDGVCFHECYHKKTRGTKQEVRQNSSTDLYLDGQYVRRIIRL